MSTLEHTASAASGKSLEPADKASPPERIIQASEGWIGIDWNEVYQSRELFDTLIIRDIKIRYKQTVFGVAWAILQPLLTMLVFNVIFNRIPGVKPEGIPYPLFLFAGLVAWTFFTSAVTSAGTSLLAQQGLLTKIYFPRLYVPASTVGAYLVDMAIGLALFVFLMPYYHYYPSINIIFLPLILLLIFCAAFGQGLVLASLTILFRDLRFVIPFLMQLVMFASPLFYQTKILPRPVQLLVAINPLTGIINAFRWSILGLPLDWSSLLISVAVTTVVLIFGLFFFRKTERYLADLL